MNKEKYLVTGAAGFIGSNLTRELVEQGKDVYPLVRPDTSAWRLKHLPIDPERYIQADINDYEQIVKELHRVRPNHIFHLATYGVYRDQKDEDKIFNTNVLGTHNLLRASRGLDLSSFINTGSVYEYADLPGKRTEEQTGEARNIYDAVKISTTALSQAYAHEHNIPICTLRLFTVYGPYEDKRRLVPSVILSLLGHNSPCVPKNTLRDFIHVSDVVRAYIKASGVSNWQGQVMNIGSGKPTQIAEFVKKLVEVVSPETKIIYNQQFSTPRDSRCWSDISKSKELLGWEPHIDLDTSLRQLVEWYRINHQYYD